MTYLELYLWAVFGLDAILLLVTSDDRWSMYRATFWLAAIVLVATGWALKAYYGMIP